MNQEEIVLEGVTEYAEDMGVYLSQTAGKYQFGIPYEQRDGYGRLVIRAYNEGGFNFTEVDLLELISWLKLHKPELLK